MVIRATMACVHAPYNTTGRCPGYAWGTTRNSTAGSSIYSSRGYAYRNCTDYVAWKLRTLGVPMDRIQGLGHGGQWYARAGGKGLPRGTSPRVGAAAVRPTTQADQFGHVAYVESVNGNGTITVSEYNAAGTGEGGTRTGTPAALRLTHFVYFGDLIPRPQGPRPSDFVGSIVQWNGDTKAQKTSWLVRPDGRRYWIPSGAEYYCWRHLSAGDKGPQSSSVLDHVIPDSGRTTYCPAMIGPAVRDTLRPGQSLKIDQSITSTDGRYRLIFQGDRNLVLYGPRGALWATNRYTGDYAIMQNDCNLVGYNLWGSPAWASGTGGLGDGCALVVQNDSNLVIYQRSGRPVWDRHRGRLV